MFTGQESGDKEKRGAKQSINSRAGAERRQRQLMTLRHKAHGEVLKHLRADHEDEALGIPEGAVGGTSNVSTALAAGADPNELVWMFNAETKPAMIPLDLLPQFVQLVVAGTTPEQVFHGTLMIRKILSVERDPPYEAVIRTGVVPKLVELLDHNHFPKLQFEAAWALTNIAAGTSENTMMLIHCNAVPKFVNLLASPDADCRDQSAWAIGNLAGEGAACRDVALANGAMPALLRLLLDEAQPLNVLRNATWAASNLCRCKPVPDLKEVVIALPAFASLLNHQDDQLVMDAAWGVSYISDGQAERVQAVLEAGVLPRIVELLRSPSNNLKTPAIRTIGNIAAGTDEQTQMIINAGALPAIAELLSNPKRAIRKETCWTISNIASGPTHQIEALVSANIFYPLLNCLQAMELDVRKEAAWCVANVTYCGSAEHIRYLVQIGVIPPLCEALRVYDSQIVTVILEALQSFLQMGESDRSSGFHEENMVVKQIIDCGGIDHLEELQKHTNKDVYNLVFNILENFFSVMDDGNADGVPMSDMQFDQPIQNNTDFQF
ncbi:unnamed protein product [Phytomonas sp. EM1]|nr:unnamed protein product [Phytomonas sp. EM1]|eukprot:CCW61680.1 unnamed protein product [Phytomonas sp. isolate EM1]